ncbi:hypothetical protein MKX01_023004 [Papaver californicum]|nr:hypothetical protein MKX01_023004 [Papaver californicum]
MHTYTPGESIFAKLPFSYYSLPYCKPEGGFKKSAENLGELLMGDQIDNSPYRFNMNRNESFYLCTTNPLNENEVKLLKQRTRDLYQVNMILENLPAMRYAKQNGINIQWTGYPVGYAPPQSSEDYIINHLKFKVLVHEYERTGVQVLGNGDETMAVVQESEKKLNGYEIVGFEVVPCSVKRDPEAMSKLQMYDTVDPVNCPVDLEKSQIIREQEQVSFSYEVEFVKSDIRWPSRWDAYLKMEGARVHWFSIMNSLMVIFFLAGIVFVIFLKAKLLKATLCDGWRWYPDFGMAVVTIVFAALGFMSPASPGMLLTGMIILYLFLGLVAGYVGVRLCITIKGTTEGWRSVSWSISCFFPGIVLHELHTLGSKSTGAIPISLYFIFISLWFCISVPLTLLGGYFGTKAEPIQYPVRTNQIPREIPARKYPSWLLVLGAASGLGGSTMYWEVLICILLASCLRPACCCLCRSFCCPYLHASQCGGLAWWWKVFYASGSVSLYVFMYSINYLIFNLRSLSGPVSAMLYLGYSLIMAIAIMLSTGTIGFLVSFYFVLYLFSSVKID